MKSEFDDQNDAETVERLTIGGLANPSIVKTDDGRIFAFTPTGPSAYKLENLTPLHAQEVLLPKAVNQSVVLQDEGSLVLYANKFKNADTLLFADIAADKIVTVIDYHNIPANNRSGNPSTTEVAPNGDKPTAQLLTHKATLQLPKSEEWKTWSGIDGKLLGQLDFVRFLEENAMDVVVPDAATLIEVCRDLQALRKVNFTSVVRLNSNNAERIEYVDETRASTKGGVEIPTSFMLNIPVYFNGPSYELLARLRYELDDGVLRLGIKLVRAEKLRQTVFKEVVSAISGATELDVIYGATA